MKITTDILKRDNEYIVRLFEDGIRNHNADYFTDDKEDAKQTAIAMCNDCPNKDKKKEFSWGEILQMDLNKDGLSKKIGIDCAYDTALPQTWLNNFVEISGLDYHKVLYSTFITYPKKQSFGLVVSAWDKVNKWL